MKFVRSQVFGFGPLSFPTNGGVVAKSLQELQTLRTLEAKRLLIRWSHPNGINHWLNNFGENVYFGDIQS